MGYLDAASAEPLHPMALQALQAAVADGWADPTRLYREGRQARLLLDAARETVAEVLGVSVGEVSFTSSGTEALQLGMQGALAARRRVGGHLVVSSVEHSAVLRVAEAHAANGGSVARVPVDRDARVSVDAFTAALRHGASTAALACLQSANHEVGTLQPVEAVAEACRAADVPLLVDAAQSVGRIPVPGGWSLLAASARKWGGPAGVGILVVRKGTRLRPPLPNEGTEGGRGPTTPNVPAVVAAAAALRARRDETADGSEAERLDAWVRRIREEVPRLVPDAEVLGPAEGRLPHLVTFSALYVDGEALVTELDRLGFAVTSGSACAADTIRPSHVLEAMGVLSEGNVRVSLPARTSAGEIDAFLRVLPGAVARVRALGPDGGEAAVRPSDAADLPELIVDARGRLCPFPVTALARRITDVRVGHVVAVLADDEAARLDVPAWCEMRGHEFVGATTMDGAPAYLVRRT